MDAVLETHGAEGFAPWPIADPAPDGLLALTGHLSRREVATALAVLSDCDDDPGDGVERIRRLLTAEYVTSPGGLRLRDTTTGVTAAPGCCAGLENWRDWWGLANGEDPWLGHDPTPAVEHTGDVVRLWPDGDRPHGPRIDVPRGLLPDLLDSVRDDLVGFLTAVDRWAASPGPLAGVRTALVERLDTALAISAPLPARTT